MNISEKKDLIIGYITANECDYMCDDEIFDCDSCSNLEECFVNASIGHSTEFAEEVDYGGYNTEEDFWEQISFVI